MKTRKFSEAQICAILREQAAGVRVAEIRRKHGISTAAFYTRRSKYGGMDASMRKRVKELEAENASGGGLRRYTPSRRWISRFSRRRWQKETMKAGSPGGRLDGIMSQYERIAWIELPQRKWTVGFVG